MLTSFPFCVAVGTLLGFLSGLGVGGGSLLMLWLTLVTGMEQTLARSVNLLFFIPSAIVSSFFRRKQGTLSLPLILPAALAGCAAAAAVGLLWADMDTGLLRKLFGILLLATGLRELFYRPRKAR